MPKPCFVTIFFSVSFRNFVTLGLTRQNIVQVVFNVREMRSSKILWLLKYERPIFSRIVEMLHLFLLIIWQASVNKTNWPHKAGLFYALYSVSLILFCSNIISVYDCSFDYSKSFSSGNMNFQLCSSIPTYFPYPR